MRLDSQWTEMDPMDIRMCLYCGTLFPKDTENCTSCFCGKLVPLGPALRICIKYYPEEQYSCRDQDEIIRLAAYILGVDRCQIEIQQYLYYKDQTCGDVLLTVNNSFSFASSDLDLYPHEAFKEAIGAVPHVISRLSEVGASVMGTLGTLNFTSSMTDKDEVTCEWFFDSVRFEYLGQEYSLGISPDLRCVLKIGDPPKELLKELNWEIW